MECKRKGHRSQRKLRQQQSRGLPT
jgi:hypothetical protein